MPDVKRIQMEILLAGMELLEKLPTTAKQILRPLANFPLISDFLMVLPRAFLGATAFDLHDVDLKQGRIAIGGVEEIMAGSKIIELLHLELAARVGEEEKNKILYEFGEKLCRWEVAQSLAHKRWVPQVLEPLILHAKILDEVQTDPLLARFFAKTMNMVSRLITDEGGWGHLDFDFSGHPLKVMLSHSQEASWLGPAMAPVCHFYTGIVAGYTGAISGEIVIAKEVACQAAGSEKCIFEVRRIGMR